MRDPFSNPAFSRRQEQYARTFRIPSVYTPQLVVDGRTETVGNDEKAVHRAIRNSAREQKADIQIQTLPASVEVSVGTEFDDAVVMLASADSSVAVSKVVRGENAGRELRHVAVIRSLKEIGVVTKGKPFRVTVPVAEGTGQKRWIAFMQQKQQGRILAVATNMSSEAK
ncbi:MAG: DUF1223 domain-containing protein [Bryobacteraceae bacterium]